MSSDQSHSEVHELSPEEVDDVAGAARFQIGGITLETGPNGFCIEGYGHGVCVTNIGSIYW